MTPTSALEFRSATAAVGGRVLWADLDLRVEPGEFVAVLGPNGAGKSSLFRAVLGQLALAAGSVSVLGHPAGRGSSDIGYVPQQKLFDRGTALRARDLVALGRDGQRLGPGRPTAARREAVLAALEQTGMRRAADTPVGLLSGGEQQRVRIAQALVSSPRLLLADEPLLSLDLQHQRAVSDAIDEHRRSAHAGVVFITHDINPILGMVDRVLYLTAGGHVVGRPEEVFQSDVLTRLYGTEVDVLDVRGRIVVVGPPAEAAGHGEHGHGHAAREGSV
jgi:zinc/manganese transport system ATP-binding protein